MSRNASLILFSLVFILSACGEMPTSEYLAAMEETAASDLNANLLARAGVDKVHGVVYSAAPQTGSDKVNGVIY